VQADCLPAGFVMRDPRNLKRDAIECFLKHLQRRQQAVNAENAFRFSHYEKCSQLHHALYHDTAAITDDSPADPQSKSKKRKNNRRDAGPWKRTKTGGGRKGNDSLGNTNTNDNDNGKR
jgi:hypothetical protein